MGASKKVPVTLLYRHILKTAKKFPSIKRESIIREIKLEFHANKTLSGKEQIQERIRAALNGLDQLAQFAGMEEKEYNWDLYLRGACE